MSCATSTPRLPYLNIALCSAIENSSVIIDSGGPITAHHAFLAKSMSEMGQTTSLFFLLFGLFVVTNGEDLFGPTLVAKVGDVPGAGSVAWVGTGCQLAVVNTTILNTDLNQNIIAQTTCNGDDTITALGISSGIYIYIICLLEP